MLFNFKCNLQSFYVPLFKKTTTRKIGCFNRDGAGISASPIISSLFTWHHPFPVCFYSSAFLVSIEKKEEELTLLCCCLGFFLMVVSDGRKCQAAYTKLSVWLL